MVKKGFHDQPFDEGTIVKLDLYRRYLKNWVPTFANQTSDKWHSINIFDFLCGKGEDSEGTPGSPLIAVEEVLRFKRDLAKNGYTVNLYFFDASEEKIDHLKSLLSKFENESVINIHASAVTFPDSLFSCLPQMNKAANMLFIDQFGIKHVNPEIIEEIARIRGTDLLFFVSSSFYKRFASTPEFSKYGIVAPSEIQDARQYDMHRIICQGFNRSIPADLGYHLAPFTIKKGANIYGLIHGSAHRIGTMKFLDECWKIDPERGEANFDIDEENLSSFTPSLFEEFDKPTKHQKFEEQLEQAALEGQFNYDRDVLDYALERGFIATRHAAPILRKLCKSGDIETPDGQPRLSKSCIKEPRRLRLSSTAMRGNSVIGTAVK